MRFLYILLTLCFVGVVTFLSINYWQDRYPLFLEFYDIPNHLASAVGFWRCGGLSLTNFWIGYGLEGSSYIYFPLYHVLQLILLSMDVPLQFISYWISWSFFPLSLLTVFTFMALVYGEKAGAYAVLLLSLSPVWMEKQWGFSPQALVFILTPLILLALAKRRYIIVFALTLACMTAHLSGAVLFLFIFLYVFHCKEERKPLLVVLALLLLAGLPALWFGLQRLKSGVSGGVLSGVSLLGGINEFLRRAWDMKGQFHSFLGRLALIGLVLCYVRRSKFFVLSSYAIASASLIFTSHALRFWSAEAIFIFSLLGALALSATHELIEKRFLKHGFVIGFVFFVAVFLLAHYSFYRTLDSFPDFVRNPTITYLKNPQFWQKSKPLFSLADRDHIIRIIKGNVKEDEFFWINSSSNINNYISAFSSRSTVYAKLGDLPGGGMKLIIDRETPGARYVFMEKINSMFNAYILEDANGAARVRVPKPLITTRQLKIIFLVMGLLILIDLFNLPRMVIRRRRPA